MTVFIACETKFYDMKQLCTFMLWMVLGFGLLVFWVLMIWRRLCLSGPSGVVMYRFFDILCFLKDVSYRDLFTVCK